MSLSLSPSLKLPIFFWGDGKGKESTKLQMKNQESNVHEQLTIQAKPKCKHQYLVLCTAIQVSPFTSKTT